jgi:hypothetical protein
MTYQTAPFFPHRRNKDGSLDSICLKCFETVGSQRTEAELTELDEAHVCNSTPLSRRNERASLTSSR